MIHTIHIPYTYHTHTIHTLDMADHNAFGSVMTLLSRFQSGKISAQEFEDSLDQFETLDIVEGRRTPLYMAACWMNVEAFDMLLKKGAQPIQEEKYALFDAIYNYSQQIIRTPEQFHKLQTICKRFFGLGLGDVNMMDKTCQHALLHHAIYRGLFDLALWLIIDQDACTDIVNCQGANSLQILIYVMNNQNDQNVERCLQLLDYLLSKCEVDWQDNSGKTALHMAYMALKAHHLTDVVSRLRAVGAREDLEHNS